MENYHCKVHFKASPTEVYEALTKQKGIQGWWTPDCTMEAKEGSKATFRFGETYTVMSIERLVPNAQVR